MRSGFVHPYYGILRYAGTDGYGWSGLSHSDNERAYFLNFNNSDVYPSYNSYFYHAFLVQNFIQALPFSHLYYVRSGYVVAGYGTLRYTGEDGYYRSRISQSDVRYAYNLYFSSSSVYLSDYGNRYHAFRVPRSIGNSGILIFRRRENDNDYVWMYYYFSLLWERIKARAHAQRRARAPCGRARKRFSRGEGRNSNTMEV